MGWCGGSGAVAPGGEIVAGVGAFSLLGPLECVNGGGGHPPFLAVELVCAGEIPALDPRADGRRLLLEEEGEVGHVQVDDWGARPRRAVMAITEEVQDPVHRH